MRGEYSPGALRGRTALLALAPLACGLVLAGCGGGSGVPAEAVVRAWSDAVNMGEDESAAKLLARGAIVVEGTRETVLGTTAEAVAWNEARRCGGLPQKVQTHADIVTVTFRLEHRTEGSCADHGASATYEFEVRKGRILFLRRLALTPAPAAAATTAG